MPGKRKRQATKGKAGRKPPPQNAPKTNPMNPSYKQVPYGGASSSGTVNSNNITQALASPQVTAIATQTGQSSTQVASDPRFSPVLNSITTSNDLANQQKATIIEQTLQLPTLQNVFIAYITYALQKGFMAYADEPSFPFWALNYLYLNLLSLATNQVPQAETLPRWIVELGQALATKSVTFGHGQAAYKFLPNGVFDPEPAVVLNTALPYNWYLYVPDESVLVDGFPVGIPPGAYNATNGSLAGSSIFQFMFGKRTVYGHAYPGHTIVSISEPSKFLKDVSAYAVNQAIVGTGSNNIGSPLTLIQNEVPILKPMLAVFAGPATNSANDNRFQNWNSFFGGDGVFSGGLMSQLLPTSSWGMKRAPKFHFIDFNEFVDVAAQWLTIMLQTYANSPTVLTAIGAGEPPPIPTCPLTFQEFRICLRNVLMEAFSASQPSTQFLFPHYWSDPIAKNYFIPYVAGSNSCFLSNGGGMLLPVPFLENMKALTMRYVTHVKQVNKNRGRKQKMKMGKDHEFWVPVLGEWTKIQTVATAYTIDYNSETLNVFAADTSSIKCTHLKSSKGASIKEEVLLTPTISMIDGSASVTSPIIGTAPIFINDPLRLAELYSLWNSYLSTSGLSTYSTQLGTFSLEAGIKAFYSGAMTKYAYAKPVSEMRTKEFYYKDTRLEKKKLGSGGNPYDNFGFAAVSSQGPLQGAIYSNVTGIWILPYILADADSSTQSTTFNFWQKAMVEPVSTAMSSGLDALTISMLHYTYASKMTKAITQSANDWEQLFEEAASKGQGGILTGMIANAIAPPSTPLGAILGGIASILPI